ncbi:putative cadherin domain-containing protein [Synechococcus sp. BIOS-E4-1]|nr:putative cadherin domain-containing protein [Synechococcus sp. BIOS-E4-1]
MVTATISDGDMATLAGITETGNAYSITITETSVAASALNILDGKTSVAINAGNITTLTGAAADLNTAYTANGNGSINGLGNEAATLSDTTLAVSVLNDLDGNTSGAIDASSINTLTSDDYNSLNTAYTAAGSGAITGLGNEAITVNNRIRASEANTLNGHTSGVVTATVTDSNGTSALLVSNALTLNGTGNAYSIFIRDRTVATTDLLSIDALTTVTINATRITRLTGTYASIISTYAAETAGTISGLGSNCSFTASGSITVAEANTLSGLISHGSRSLTATISNGDMATLAGISESGHNLSITITDTSVAAAALNTLDGKTDTTINASNITTLTGTAADLNTAYASSGISGLNNEAVTLSDTSLSASVLNTLDSNTSGTINASSIDTLSGAAADLNTAYTSAGISGLSDEAITLTDTSLAASILNALDGHTSGTINAGSINTLSGNAADLITAYASSGISGLNDEAISVSSGIVTTAQANTLSAATSAVVTATIADGDMATLAGLTETGNAYTITITDTSVAASALNTLDGKTTVSINAGNITTLTGAAADLNTAYTANGNGSISGLGNEAATLSDTSLAVSVLNILDGRTSGSIDAGTINTLTGTAADLNTAYTSGGISNLGNEAVTLSDTTLAVSVLNDLDGNTSGTINANSINTLTGAAADLNTAYTANANGSISGLNNEAVTLSDTSLAVSVLNNLDGNTSGTINANTINTLTGSAADLITAYDSGGINGLANEAVTLTDTTLTVSVLNALDGRTSGTINANSINTLTGAATDLITAFASGGINNLGATAVNVNSGSASTSQANNLAAATSGVVTATLSDGDMDTLAGLTETGNAYSITITDNSVAAAALNTLDGKTTVAINASNITTLTGAAADLNTAYTGNGNGSITGLGNEAATLSDTSLAVSVLNDLDGNTSGAINANSINTLTGSAADLNTAYDSGGISNLGNEAVTLTDSSLAVSVLNALDGRTSGSINANSINTLSGTAADLISTYAANGSGISGLGNEAVNVNSGTASTTQANSLAADTSGVVTATISEGDMATLADLTETSNAYAVTITDTRVNADELNTLNSKTTVNIDCGNITQIVGAISDIATAYTSGGFTGLGDEEIIFTFANIQADLLNAIDAANSRVINASGVASLTGSASDLNTAYASSGVSGLGNEPVTLTDSSLSASVLNTLDGNTSGTIDASSINTLTGTATDLNTAYASNAAGGISNLGNEAVTLSDSSLTATVLNNLDGNTSGTIDASSINTLTGTATDLNTAYTSAGISGLNNEAITLTDTSLTASVLNTLDGRTSGTINASSINTLAGTAADLNTAYTSAGISGLNNEAITLTDTSLTASVLNTLDGRTSGAINASSINTLSGTAADLNTAYGSSGISNLGDEAVTLTDTSLAVSVLNTLDGNTSASVNASSVNTLSGTAADLKTAYDSSGISGLGNEAVTITDTSLAGSVSFTQLGPDIDGEAANDYSGRSVSLSSDGSTVAIGAYGNDGNGTNSGHTRIYQWDSASSSWNQRGSDIDGEAAGDYSGFSVSLSSDGSIVAIGAYNNDGNGSSSGHTRIYKWDGSSWNQRGSDIDGEATSDLSGLGVSLSSDGSTVAIGAYGNDGNGSNSGHTRIYKWDGSSWHQRGSDIDGEATSDYSGFSVSLSSDGSIVAIGAYRNDGNGSNSGHTRIYQWNSASSSWNQRGSDIDGEATGDLSGLGVSLSSDGSTVAIGALGNDGSAGNAGHVRVFDLGNQITLTASVLNTLDGNTSGTIDASNITTLTGAAAELNTTYASSGISNLGNEAITLTDTSLTASVLNTLDGHTSGSIDANSINTLSGAAAEINTAYASSGISNLGNEAVTLTDTSLTASVLNTLDGHTSGTVNASSINTLTGTAADLNTAYASTGISNLGDEAVTLTDTSLTATVLNTLDSNTTGAINASSINTLSGAAAEINTAYASSGISNLGNEAVTLTDTTLAASVLNTLDGNTTGSIDASNINTLSGVAAELNTSYASSGISNLGNEAVTLTDTTLAASVLNTLDGHTSGSINANSINTLSGAAAELNTTYASSGISNLGKEAVTLTDTTLTASVLNTLDGRTSGTINANSINTLTGTAADLNIAYASSGISNLGNEAVTLTDTSLAASVLNTLDGNTTGSINANSINSLTGTAADLINAYSSSGISGLNDEALTLSGASFTASILNSLDGHTTGVINAGSINTLFGSASDLISAYSSSGINTLGDEAITLIDTSLSASVLNNLASKTSGNINAFIINTLTGTAAELNTAYTSTGISNLGNEAVTLTDTSLTASVLNTLDGNTSGSVNATSINTLSGAAADLNTAYASSGISNLGDETVTLTDTSLAASVLNTLDGNTSGSINASSINTLSGAAADLNTAYASSGISNLGDEAVTLTDTSLAASVLNTLNGNTSGSVNANSVNTLTGAAADLNTAYASTGISNLGNEAVTLTDTSLAATVLNTLDGNTSGSVNANSINTLAGSAADLNTAYSSTGISNLGDEAVTLTDTSLAASVLNTLDDNTSGSVNASSVNTLSGAATDLNTAYSSSGISNLGDENLNVSTGTATTSEANTLAAATTGVVTATISDGDMATLAGLNETGNAYSISVTDSSVSTSALNNLGNKTTVAINATDINKLTGTAADLITLYVSSGFSNLGSEIITLTDTSLAASILNRLDGNTSGSIDAGTINTLSGTAADLNAAYTSSGISNLGDEAVTLIDTTLAASILNTLDGHTTGIINASSISELTGSESDIATSYASDGISNLNKDAETRTPSIALSSAVRSLKRGQTAEIIFTLSSPSSDFTESDLTYSGGSISNFSGSGTNYSARFTPAIDSTDDGMICVKSNKFCNSLGNFNRDGSETDNVLVFTVNTIDTDEKSEPTESDNTIASKKGANSGTSEKETNSANLETSKKGVDSDNDGVEDVIEREINPVSQLPWDHNDDGIPDFKQRDVATFPSSNNGRSSLTLIKNTLLDQATKAGGALISHIALRFQGIKREAERIKGDSINALNQLTRRNNNSQTQESTNSVLNTTDQVGFRLVPEVIVDGDVSKSESAAYRDTANQQFANAIHRVDYRFDNDESLWNALIKPDASGQLRFFGFDPITGLGGILMDRDGDGRPDGATLFLRDNGPGDLNPDPFIIEDPIGAAELQSPPRLTTTADGLGLTVEGPEGLGLWIRLNTESAAEEWQDSLLLISNERNRIGEIGATIDHQNLGRSEIYLQAGEELRFQNSSNENTDQTSLAIKLQESNENGTWSLLLNEESGFSSQETNKLEISISGHLTPENLDNFLIARSQSSLQTGVLNLQALHQDMVTLRVEASSESGSQNRLAFIRFDDDSEVLSVNGVKADGSDAFQNMVRQSLINPNEEQIDLTGNETTSLEWTIKSSEYGLYAPVLITSDGLIYTANNASANSTPNNLKILGMNHFGFEDNQQSESNQWDYNDVTVQISVI